MLLMRFVALAFVMPTVEHLISVLLLVVVLVACAGLLLLAISKSKSEVADIATRIVYVICALIGVVVLLETFTNWRG